MTIAEELKTRMAKLTQRVDKLRLDLDSARHELAVKRAELGAVMLAGNGNGKADSLLGEITKLQAKEAALLGAIENEQAAGEVGKSELATAELKADQAECSENGKQLQQGTYKLIRDLYAQRDELGKLVQLYTRNEILNNKHGGRLKMPDYRYGGAIFNASRAITQVSRFIEMAAPDLVERAGQSRRY